MTAIHDGALVAHRATASCRIRLRKRLSGVSSEMRLTSQPSSPFISSHRPTRSKMLTPSRTVTRKSTSLSGRTLPVPRSPRPARSRSRASLPVPISPHAGREGPPNLAFVSALQPSLSPLSDLTVLAASVHPASDPFLIGIMRLPRRAL
jgi:hypothetical protein